MNKKECSCWPEVKACFEEGREAAAESIAFKHLKECRFCRQRLYEERRLTLLLDDLFAAHRKAPVPVLNLKSKLAGVPAKTYFPWPGFQRRPGLLAGGLVLSFLVVLLLFYRFNPTPEPIAPVSVLVSNKTPLPVEKSPSPKGRGAIHGARGRRGYNPSPTLTGGTPVLLYGSDKPHPYTAAEKDEKAAGAGEDFGQVFWSRFDRTVSAIAFPQEIRALSRIPWPDREKT